MLEGRPDADNTHTWRSFGEITWLLRPPRQHILELVPELAKAHAAAEAAQCYENFCAFYVAVTRARRALYLVAPAMPDPDKRTCTAAGWIDAVFGDRSDGIASIDGRTITLGASFGRWDWFAKLPKRKLPEPEPPVQPAPPPPFHDRRLGRRTPSREEAFPIDSIQLFSTDSAGARDRGLLIHSLFEQVIDPADLAPVIAWWHKHVREPEDWQSAALDEVRACLADSVVRRAIGNPQPGTAIWRERTFDAVIDGAWVTGTFDRVVIEDNRARIIDFKTDAVDDEAAIRNKVDGYRPQLALYRRALGLLTGLPESAISTIIVFTKSARVCVVTHDERRR